MKEQKCLLGILYPEKHFGFWKVKLSPNFASTNADTVYHKTEDAARNNEKER